MRANSDHEAKFPIELPRRVIKLLTAPGDMVLDCFMGSGTTALAAIQEQRNYIGIELDEQYVASSRAACEKELKTRDLTQHASSQPTDKTARKGKTTAKVEQIALLKELL